MAIQLNYSVNVNKIARISSSVCFTIITNPNRWCSQLETKPNHFIWESLLRHQSAYVKCLYLIFYCPASRTTLVATRFWVVMICPIIKCLTVLEFSFILFDLCLFITIFNFILNYVPIVTFWIFTYHKIWILLIIFCFIWSYWIIYFSTSLEVFWSVVS